MSDTYDIDVSGADAVQVIIAPQNGADGPPLGHDGNGKDGTATFFHRCTKPAEPGKPGAKGEPAPPATSGGNGGDAFSVVITCSEYTGAPLSIRNVGGNGANGNDGGTGGNGSDGGNAGVQPKGCTGIIPGGVGGDSGGGGTAGGAGDGGNAGDVVIVAGPGIAFTQENILNQGGNPGTPGRYGKAGAPGKGGIGSDKTQALAGAQAGDGGSGRAGKGGYGGSTRVVTDGKQPATYFRLSIQKHIGS